MHRLLSSKTMVSPSNVFARMCDLPYPNGIGSFTYSNERKVAALRDLL